MTSSYNGCIEVDVEKVIEAQAASLEGAKLSKVRVAQLHAGQIVRSSGGSIQVYDPPRGGGMFEGRNPYFFDKLFQILHPFRDTSQFTPQGRQG